MTTNQSIQTVSETLPTGHVEQISIIMEQAPSILDRNRKSVEACNQAGEAILDTIEANGGRINSDELDAAAGEYIDKVKVTVKNMNDRRKTITQLLTAVSKNFTTLEADIDLKTVNSLPYRIQEARNAYAAYKIAEQKKREQEAARMKAIEDEKISYRAEVSQMLEDTYSKYVSKTISELDRIFSAVTTGNYKESCELIHNTSSILQWDDFIKTVKCTITAFHIDDATIKAIKFETANQKKAEFPERYAFEIDEYKTSLLERMPSKYEALREEAALAHQDAEAARKAQEERKAQEAAAALKAEEERKRLEEENRLKQEEIKNAQAAQAAFDFMQATTPETNVKAKVTKKIKVLGTKGYIDIFQRWFAGEGSKLSLEELDKIMKKMITYCEKEANRDGGDIIKSNYIQYIDDVKAK